jgi:hypothetical protein
MSDERDALLTMIIEAKAEVVDAARKVRDIEAQAESIRSKLKAAKADWEAAVDALVDAVEGRSQPKLPFPEAGDGDSEVWRSVKIEELSITSHIAKCLHDIDLATVGDISDYVQGGGTLANIPGIGDAKREKLENALDMFWAQWNAREAAQSPDALPEEGDDA